MGFGDEIKKAADDMVNTVDEFRQAVTIKLFNSVIEDTPVDSGRLRANWQTNEGSPATGEIDSTDQNRPLKEVEDVVSRSKRDGEINLTNNLPYSVDIEFGGSSTKAPQGMLRKNVARISDILRSQK